MPKPCEVCHIGTLNPVHSTYTSWLQDQFIMVPDLNAWLCDVCGEFQFDSDIIARIELLLGNQPAVQSRSRRTDGNLEAGDFLPSAFERRRGA